MISGDGYQAAVMAAEMVEFAVTGKAETVVEMVAEKVEYVDPHCLTVQH